MEMISSKAAMKGQPSDLNHYANEINSQSHPTGKNTVRHAAAELGRSSTFAEGEISMEPILYNAVMNALQNHHSCLDSRQKEFDLQLTPNKNTILHVAAEFNRKCCAETILDKSPLLFRRKNNYGETPLHYALAAGHFEVANLLIDRAKLVVQKNIEIKGEGGEPKVALREMLTAKNQNGDTVLHLAARCTKKELLEKILDTEDPELDYGPNNAGETPLYLVVERNFKATVLESLITKVSQGTCERRPAYSGPNGSTAMHMAAINNNGEVISILQRWKDHLIRDQDNCGWTPLHYAARCRNIEAIKTLLSLDKSLAYIPTSNAYDGNTALHTAAAFGDTKMMEKILFWSPDCWEVVNNKKQNILHIAADLERDQEMMDYILQMPWATRVMSGQDKDGNTPFHVLASKGQLRQFQREHKSSLSKFDRNYMHVCNKKGLTPLEVQHQNDLRSDSVETEHEEKRKHWQREIRLYNRRDIAVKDRDAINKWKKAKERKDEGRKQLGEQRRRIAKTHMIVATLIATISVTASYTVPGGYDPNKDSDNGGMPILLRELAFKVFVIFNTAAVIFSTSSVFLFVSASVMSNKYEEHRQTIRYKIALVLTVIAMVALMVAFISGTFAMLERYFYLAIILSAVSCLTYVVYAVEFFTYIRDKLRRDKENSQPYFSTWEPIEEGPSVRSLLRKVGLAIFARQRQGRMQEGEETN